MRLLALVFAFLCSVPAASAATLTATPDTLGKVWSAAQAGDTIKLSPAAFPWAQLPGRQFSPRVTIDAGKATIAGWYIAGQKGLTVKGGTWGDDGLRFDSFADVSVMDAKFEGPARKNLAGLWFNTGTNAYAARLDVSGYNVGVSFSSVTGFESLDLRISAPRSDGVTFPDSHKGKMELTFIRHTNPGQAGEHPDGFQCWSLVGKPPVSDIEISRATVIGYSSGIGCYNSADGGVRNVWVHDSTFIAGFAHGITLTGAQGVRLERNFVGTYPGVRDQALINVDDPKAQRCGNVVQSYGLRAAPAADAAC